MTGLDLTLPRVSVTVSDAARHEHRIEPIVRRGMELLADGLLERWTIVEGLPVSVTLGELHIPTVQLPLATLSDEQAAARLAEAIGAAIRLRLEV